MEDISNSQLSTTKPLQDGNVKFSILTPCFNSAGTIAKTIESVIGQTYPNWEHIIIDGGSTDGTTDIIRKNETRYQGRLKFVSEPDSGPNEAIRKGLLMVDGELVGFLGSDDWYEIDALDVVNKIHASSPNHDVYYGILRHINQDGNELFLYRINHQCLKNDTLCFPACFITAKAYRENGWIEKHDAIADDYAFLLGLYFNGGSFMPIDHILANYKVTGRSSQNFFKGNVEKVFLQRKYGIISRGRAGYLLFKAFINAIFVMLRSLFITVHRHVIHRFTGNRKGVL